MAGGVELAAWCDFRIAGAGARFGCLERRWGVPLIDGGTIRLPRIVGLGRALDLILTGREFDAEEAERIGFVNRVVPIGSALEQAVEVANGIAASPWNAVLHDRVRRSTKGWGSAWSRASRNEDVHGRQVIFDPGFQAGVDRFVENQRSRQQDGRR